MRNENKRNGIIIGALLITIAFMTIGYATLAANLNLTAGSTTGDASWEITFKSITPNADLSTSGATEVEPASANGTSASFNVKLAKPGEKMVYDIVIQNTGTIDATFTDVAGVDTLNNAAPTELQYTVERLNGPNGSVATGTADLLKTNGENYFRVTVEWPGDSTTVPPQEANTKTGTITFNYTQKN